MARSDMLRSWGLLLLVEGAAITAYRLFKARSKRRNSAEITPYPLSIYRPPVVDLTESRHPEHEGSENEDG